MLTNNVNSVLIGSISNKKINEFISQFNKTKGNSNELWKKCVFLLKKKNGI